MADSWEVRRIKMELADARRALEQKRPIPQPIPPQSPAQIEETWRRQDAARVKHRLRKYGLTEDDVVAMEHAQGNRCAICRTDKPPRHNRTTLLPWFVDHCHATGKVRGLLCHRCNGGLSFFRDDPDALRRAADYLDATRGDNGK